MPEIDLKKIENAGVPQVRRYLYFRDRRTSKCETCGKEFLVKTTHPKQKYCGMDCAGLGVNGKFTKKEQIIEAINKTQFRKDAAALLGICPATLSRDLKRHGINIPLKQLPYSDISGNGYPVIYGEGETRYRVTHRIVAEKALGRKLKPGEVVHHINMNKLDSRPSNLLICTNEYHRQLHHKYALKFAGMFL